LIPSISARCGVSINPQIDFHSPSPIFYLEREISAKFFHFNNPRDQLPGKVNVSARNINGFERTWKTSLPSILNESSGWSCVASINCFIVAGMIVYYPSVSEKQSA